MRRPSVRVDAFNPEKENQRKANVINMPDIEFCYLLQDITEVITLYNKNFFSLVDKLIVNASLPSGNLQK